MANPVPYHLGQFPPSNDLLDWHQLIPLIGPANGALSRYDGLISAIPNADVLLSPLTTQEAVLSSRIEGTIVTMGEVLEIEAGGNKNIGQTKIDDAEEVLNYRQALRFASDSVKERPLSLHLIRETHEVLLRGVRGRDTSPGEFRTMQNWIGARGCSIDEANFIPIPQEHLLGGLDRWETYLNNKEQLDPLVQLALIHLEFEAIHPFKDGNGRLGRMIIPLFLLQCGVLSSPSFYMSGYLETKKDEYMDRMRAVSKDGLWTEWCMFFLEGVVDQANQDQKKAQQIIDLHSRMHIEIAEQTRSQFAGLAAEFIFSRPVFSTSMFVNHSGIPRTSAIRILRSLRNGNNSILKIFRESSGRVPAIFAFTELLNIAEGRNVF